MRSIRGRLSILQRSTSLEHIGGTTVELAVFDVNGSEVMMRGNEQMRGQIGSPEPTEASENKVRYPHPDTKAEKCHVQERHTADTTRITVPKFSFSPAISGEYPNYF